MTAFRELYGNSIRMRIIEFLMTHLYTEFAVGDMAQELKISRPKAYEIVEEYLAKSYIKKSRIIGRTQLYTLNGENHIMKIHRRNFRECIKMVIDEYTIKNNKSGSSPNIGVASAKGR